MKASLSVNRWSGVYANDKNRWGPQLALTTPSSTSTGYWHSGGEKQPWIEFRMAEETEVDKIKIIDRLNCCPERFEEVEVRVGDDNVNLVSCGVQSYKGSTTYTYNCPANARGNHIFINKYGTTSNWFHINNVEVSKRTSAGELNPEFIDKPEFKSQVQAQPKIQWANQPPTPMQPKGCFQ